MSPGVTRMRYEWSLAKLGGDHPRTRALYGHWLARNSINPKTKGSPGYVPMRGSTLIEDVAWHRECGVAGYLNRHERRRIARGIQSLPHPYRAVTVVPNRARTRSNA